MMGNKKPATIRKEIEGAFAARGINPIAHLESEISKAKGKVDPTELESLYWLRDALATRVTKKGKLVRDSAGRNRKTNRVGTKS